MKKWIVVLIILSSSALLATLPYPVIPNYTGTNAGLSFRNAVNSNFSYVETQLAALLASVALKESSANKGAASGYAPLNSSSQLAYTYLPTAAFNGVLKYTSGIASVIGTSSTNCIHEDGSSGACGGGSSSRPLIFGFSGGGAPLSGSSSYCHDLGPASTITAAQLTADVVGSVTIDFKTVLTASYTGVASASSITAAAIPTLSSAIISTPNVSTWSKTIAANTTGCAVLTSPSTIGYVTLTLTVQ